MATGNVPKVAGTLLNVSCVILPSRISSKWETEAYKTHQFAQHHCLSLFGMLGQSTVDWVAYKQQKFTSHGWRLEV